MNKSEELQSQLLSVEKSIADVSSFNPVIENDNDLTQASDMLVRVSRVRKDTEKKRKEFTQPLMDYKRKVDNEFKMKSEPLEGIESKIKEAIVVYHDKKEEEARVEQVRIRKEEEQKQREVEEARQKALKENPEVELPPPAPVTVITPVEAPKTTVRSSEGTVSMRKVWAFEIIDPNLVPKRCWSIDETIIRKEISEGQREIPGIKIFQKTQVSSRS